MLPESTGLCRHFDPTFYPVTLSTSYSSDSDVNVIRQPPWGDVQNPERSEFDIQNNFSHISSPFKVA